MKTAGLSKGYTIFCDDIRQEMGGKVSFVGSYRTALHAHGEFPFTLPKFGFAVVYSEPMDTPKEDLEFKIMLPGETEENASLTGMMKLSEMAADAPDLSDEEKAETEPAYPIRLKVEAHVIAAPLTLKQPGVIRVRGYKRGEKIHLGSLVVRKASAVKKP